ncbi:MAG: Ig-like domain-containing protein [Gemmatimonadota bacterium]
MRHRLGGRPFAAAFLLLLATVSACRDGTGPGPLGATVRIYLGSTAFDEQTVAVGQVVELSAKVLDAAGKPLPSQAVQWSSDAPGVASVDENGIVEARAVGLARIIARSEVGEDTARINVAEGLAQNDLPVCTAAEALGLEVGQSIELGGAETLPVCLSGGNAGAEYTLIALNTGTTSASTLQLRVFSAGLGDGSPSASRSPQAAGGPRRPAPDEAFHERLRSDISRRLEPQLRAGVDPGDFARPTVQLTPGQTISYNVETTSSNGCTAPDRRGGRVRAVGQRAVAVADTMNPANGFTQADYDGFVEFFDREVWPLVTGTFGDPSDIDGNDKVVIFFTRAVNELKDNQNAASYVGGFFFNRDLFATSTCEGSNAAEMFYMLVPDPATRPLFTREFVARTTRNVLVHEFQHLVNDSRRLHVNSAPVWEETWLNEGLSHIAEELMFYRQSGFGPERNLGAADFGGSAAVRDAFVTFQLENVGRLTSFLRVPESTSFMGPDLLSTRGAAWYFLRYVADHYPGSEGTLWRDLVTDARMAGLDNLREALGGDPLQWARDWTGAVYLDDLGVTAESKYTIPSWNMRDLYPALRQLGMSGSAPSSYPLRVETLNSVVQRALSLPGGAAAYSRARVPAGTTASIRHVVGTSPLLPPPSRVKVTVVRTK